MIGPILVSLFSCLVAWLLLRFWDKRRDSTSRSTQERLSPEAEQAVLTEPEDDTAALAVGTRVQLCGLLKKPEYNGTFAVIIREDKSSSRVTVRREIAKRNEPPTITVKASNLIAAPILDSLAAVQQLVDAAPPGARVTLARGHVTAGDGDLTPGGDDSPTLVLKSAISLVGMGSRSRGTELGFSVETDSGLVGDVLELAGLHITGSVDISPRNLARLRLANVSISVPSRDNGQPALYLDEICAVPRRDDLPGTERVLMEDCWVRGGAVGVRINAVGVLMRRCRVTNAATWGIHSNALFTIDGCTIGDCGKVTQRGGGIVSRAGCTLLRGDNGVGVPCTHRIHQLRQPPVPRDDRPAPATHHR